MNSNTWYSEALEKLSPLRFHLEEVLNELELYNTFQKRIGCNAMVAERQIKAAREAQKIAEDFFTQGK